MSELPGQVGLGPCGRTDSIHDIPGLRVGHYTRTDPGWLTGTTVVLGPDSRDGLDLPQMGMTCGVDVRGGGPGTRETDALDPRNLVERVHAVCLSGGSAFGLAAADGLMRALAAEGIGLPMGGPAQVVPIVPAAVVFDLGRGGVFDNTPDADFGRCAFAAARGIARPRASRPATGNVGAGTGATAGGFKGGVGTASRVLPDGSTVAALVVCNALGEVLAQDGTLWAMAHLPSHLRARLRPPSAQEVRRARAGAANVSATPLGRPGMATTIGVVATDATLTKAQCAKLAGVAHDGLARAVRPVHTMFDGDTFFGVATGSRSAPDPVAFHHTLAAGADVVTASVVDALLSAQSIEGAVPERSWRSYRQAFPSGVVCAPDSEHHHDEDEPEPGPGSGGPRQ